MTSPLKSYAPSDTALSLPRCSEHSPGAMPRIKTSLRIRKPTATFQASWYLLRCT